MDFNDEAQSKLIDKLKSIKSFDIYTNLIANCLKKYPNLVDNKDFNDICNKYKPSIPEQLEIPKPKIHDKKRMKYALSISTEIDYKIAEQANKEQRMKE